SQSPARPLGEANPGLGRSTSQADWAMAPTHFRSDSGSAGRNLGRRPLGPLSRGQGVARRVVVAPGAAGPQGGASLSSRAGAVATFVRLLVKSPLINIILNTGAGQGARYRPMPDQE